MALLTCMALDSLYVGGGACWFCCLLLLEFFNFLIFFSIAAVHLVGIVGVVHCLVVGGDTTAHLEEGVLG